MQKASIELSSREGRAPRRPRLTNVTARIRWIDLLLSERNHRILLIVAGSIFALEYCQLLLIKAAQSGPALEGSPSYSRIGEAIAEGHTSFLSRPPLYPTVIALLMKLSRANWEHYMLALQGASFILLGLIAVQIAYLLDRSMKMAAIAALLFAADLLFVMEAFAQRETVFFSLAILLSTALAVFAVVREREYAALGILGAVSAAAHLLRPNGFLLPVLVVIYIWLAGRQKSIRERLLSAGCVLGVFLALVVPWQIHLSYSAGEWTLVSARTAGPNLWKGNHRDFERVYPWVDIDVLDDTSAGRVMNENADDPKVEKEFRAIASENIRHSPGTFVRRFFYKLAVFFLPVPTPLGTGDLEETPQGLRFISFVPNWREIAIGVPYMLVILAGVALALWRSHGYSTRVRHFIGLSLFIMFVFACTYSVTFSETRYRLPFDPSLAVVAAAGFGLHRKKRGQKRLEIRVVD